MSGRPDVAAVLACLESGWLTMGPRTEALESAWCAAFGAPHAFAVAGEAAAVQLALLAGGVVPGDAVAVPALAPRRVLAGARAAGARLLPVDVQSPAWPLIDPDAADAALRAGARALIAVHLEGLPAPAAALAERAAARGAMLVEAAGTGAGLRLPDGRPAGAAGAAVSFDLADGPLAIGEGGMVACRDPDLAEAIRLRRSHAMTSGTWDRHRGHADTYDVLAVGFNHRLDEPRAALAASRLARLPADLARRRAFAAALLGAAPPGALDGAAPAGAPLAFATAAERDAALAALAAAGLVVRTWAPWAEARGVAPVAAAAAARTLVVEPGAGDPEAAAERVLAALRAAGGQPPLATRAANSS